MDCIIHWCLPTVQRQKMVRTSRQSAAMLPRGGRSQHSTAAQVLLLLAPCADRPTDQVRRETARGRELAGANLFTARVSRGLRPGGQGGYAPVGELREANPER